MTLEQFEKMIEVWFSNFEWQIGYFVHGHLV
jgi:hypothetical protein